NSRNGWCALIKPSGKAGLPHSDPFGFNGTANTIRYSVGDGADKGRRWRNGGKHLQMRENGVERRAA
ncbi:MAG: hypothetical protein FD118_4153, partial [Rhodocyclaceae bacterium]